MLRVLDLFSGIGGFSLGLERTGEFETAAFCEIDTFCQKVLKKHWPEVPLFTDVKTLNKEEVDKIGPIDVICGGFPCQDISIAGNQAGIYAGRSGLWWEFIRLIRAIRPRYALVENVAALLDNGLHEVLGSLAESGYDAEWALFSAREFGLPHKRERCFVIAYPASEHGRTGGLFPAGRKVRKIKVEFRGLLSSSDWSKTNPWKAIHCKPPVYRKDDGLPGEVDELRALGNAICPDIPEYIGKCILNFDR